MNLIKLLGKIKELENLKTDFKGVDRTQIINITNDGWIQILRPPTKKWCESSAWIDVRDWEKVKNSIDTLLSKEI